MGNFKDNRIGWLLLGTPETSEKDNEMLRMVNGQFRTNYEKDRPFLGDGNVKLFQD